jgi:acetyltransferase-like isoleucine patch superfamily enzyme
MTVQCASATACFRRWRRDLWNLLICHVPSRRVRRFWLKRMVGGIAPDAFVAQHVTILDPHRVFLNARCVINAHCILDGRGGELRIGEDTDVGTHTHIWTLQHDMHSPTHATVGGPVRIDDHVWIASRVTIVPAVHIGRGAVLATGSVVTNNVEPRDVVAGVPARPIGRRDNPLTYELSYNPRFR